MQIQRLLNEISSNQHRRPRATVPDVASVEDRTSLLIFSEPEERVWILEDVHVGFALVDLPENFRLEQPLTEQKRRRPGQEHQAVSWSFLVADPLLVHERLEGVLSQPLHGVHSEETSVIDLEHGLTVLDLDAVAQPHGDLLDAEHEGVGRNLLVGRLHVDLDTQRSMSVTVMFVSSLPWNANRWLVGRRRSHQRTISPARYLRLPPLLFILRQAALDGSSSSRLVIG
mmetsp:Transcript_26962/g.88158  ORF Transcript_26962/g.88158 Transcript_26962/m.88158 type:complete len:228 (+) Transcript_26962:781-1464(+)